MKGKIRKQLKIISGQKINLNIKAIKNLTEHQKKVGK